MEYEITITQATGVAVSFKQGSADGDAVENALQASDLLKQIVDARVEWAKDNMPPRDKALVKMQEEQQDVALEQWEARKAANKTALKMLRDE